ncbi:metallophosphoesterase [Candidatus Falkowbacteria bacterium]|nr:metallophosphoesterase [Candidatus Falkowbacteria bacterium]
MPKTKILSKTGITLLIIGALLLGYSFVEPYWIEEKVMVFIDRDVPSVFENTKIVFMADVHCGPFLSNERASKIVSRVNALEPDLIILGGDYVQRDKKYIAPCFEELSRLEAPLGVYGVTGNHDFWEDYDLTVASMEKAGIILLDENSEWIEINGEKIKLGGVSDFWEGTPSVLSTIKDTDENDFVLLVSHNPDFSELIRTKNIDLVLAGHTHGGQATFFGLWAPFIPSLYGQKYRTGMVELENTKVLVTNGVGAVTPPARFFARPQINIIYLRKE